MKIDKASKLEKVAAKEAGRYAMNRIEIDTTDSAHPVAVATNGRILAVIPVEMEDGDEGGPIPVDALKEARRGAVDGKSRIETNGTLRVWAKNGPITYERPPFHQFPDWRAVMPKERGEIRVQFNAKYLHDLANAMGTDEVCIRFHHDSKKTNHQPIAVEPIHGIQDSFGVLMPITD